MTRCFLILGLALPLFAHQVTPGSAQAVGVGIDPTRKAARADVALLDAAGAQVVPEETNMASSTWAAVPFVGIKAKLHFKAPKDIPSFSPTRLMLGKTNPEKNGGMRLARFVEDGDDLLLKAKILFSLSIDSDCAPFKDADQVKAKQDADGVWTLELPVALAPGTYALVAATGHKGLIGMEINAKARIFKVPTPAGATSAPTASAPK